MEALGVAVLPGSAGVDLQPLDGYLAEPASNRVGNEFRPTVAAMRLGKPRMANNSASVSITSSLVMLRSTFSARQFRVYPSTIDSYFRELLEPPVSPDQRSVSTR